MVREVRPDNLGRRGRVWILPFRRLSPVMAPCGSGLTVARARLEDPGEMEPRVLVRQPAVFIVMTAGRAAMADPAAPGDVVAIPRRSF